MADIGESVRYWTIHRIESKFSELVARNIGFIGIGIFERRQNDE